MNEFETIPAFTVIAGSNIGGWSARELCVEILEVIDKCTEHEHTKNLWHEIAKTDDDTVGEYLDDICECFTDHVELLPQFCVTEWRDNEFIVVPDLEEAKEDCHIFEDTPERRSDDHVLVVNDHGNVTCMEWDYPESEYREIWSVV